ncbi:hypothetical protein [Kineococcus indalonis]|uniref:hypothetical protein n=1 Tax=Kineococcus indalonis TaxID=2696566 RepID=UPI00141215A6|nr:hypothetical protein [Kineococcus indalonis]NAZ84791.1 hypothetical protein [Kineococcus indalonis]
MHAPPGIVPGFPAGRDVFVWRGVEAAALDLDFASPDRPTLVTDVLGACAEPPATGSDREDLWRLSLAARVGGLLAVLASTTRSDVLDRVVSCPGCGEDLEVSLPVALLLDLARSAEAHPETVVDGPDGPVTLRRPRGSDQRAWRQAGHLDPEAAVIATLVVEGAATDPAVLDTALAEFDPLTCFRLDVGCPSCGLRSGVPLDLEGTLLLDLARAQARTIRDVAALARRYGWSEAEVLAVPAWRRRTYLELTDWS